MDLALLAMQAGSCPAGDVVGEAAPDKPRRHKTLSGKPPRVGNVVQVLKHFFLEFCLDDGAKNSSGNIATRR
jgi:hypothetical protein